MVFVMAVFAFASLSAGLLGNYYMVQEVDKHENVWEQEQQELERQHQMQQQYYMQQGYGQQPYPGQAQGLPPYTSPNAATQQGMPYPQQPNPTFPPNQNTGNPNNEPSHYGNGGHSN